MPDNPWDPTSPNYLVLPSPVVAEGGTRKCNKALMVNGTPMAYCTRWVWPRARRRGFRRMPAGAHPGKHRVEWS